MRASLVVDNAMSFESLLPMPAQLYQVVFVFLSTIDRAVQLVRGGYAHEILSTSARVVDSTAWDLQ